MTNTMLRITILAIALFSFGACSSMPNKFIWKVEETKEPVKSSEMSKEDEATPADLVTEKVNPISREDAIRTALSRPKVVKVVDLRKAKSSGGKYYEVIDQREGASSGLVIDESARAVRIVTYDNNAIRKDFELRFGTVWERAIEAVMEVPLHTIDRSSGVITTAWLFDKVKDSGLLSLNLGSGGSTIRYKYTIRIADHGAMSSIKVIPFAQVLASGGWRPAKPSLVVTEKMFQRIEREIMAPLSDLN